MIAYFIVLIVALALMYGIAYMLKNLKAGDGASEEKLYLPYVKRNYLMTQAEHNFYKVLEEVVAGKYHIIPQVQLSSIVDVNKYEKLRKTYQNKIDKKCLDFVLFDIESFSPKIVIELDDSSHQLNQRQERDRFVDLVMQKIGLKIEHIKTAYSYEKTEIIKIL